MRCGLTATSAIGARNGHIAIAWHRDRERAPAAADLVEVARALFADVGADKAAAH